MEKGKTNKVFSNKKFANDCWNASIYMLRKGMHKFGWELYAYGLIVDAGGPQKWQRSMLKVFNNEQLRVARPNMNLKGLSILLLGEQGIGDSMMFATLIKEFRNITSAGNITFVPGNRLTSIYKNAFENDQIKVISGGELAHLNAGEFDVQLPVGSMTEFIDMNPEKRILNADNSILRCDMTKVKKQRRIYSEWDGGNWKKW